MGSNQTWTGRNAFLYLGTGSAANRKADSVFAISDFNITLDRGTVEQELVGQAGNYFTQGALSVEGSLTSCKLGSGATGKLLGALVNNQYLNISGGVSTRSGLRWHFKSCQITGFDISIGDASTISEGSVDFTVLRPYKVSSVSTDADTAMSIIRDYSA